MGSLLKALFALKPDALQGSNKAFTFADLTELGSIDEARDYLVEREIESLLRDNHADQFKSLETRFGVVLTKDLAVWPAFIELTERRNLFVHNRGIVTRHYLAKCKAGGSTAARQRGAMCSTLLVIPSAPLTTSCTSLL